MPSPLPHTEPNMNLHQKFPVIIIIIMQLDSCVVYLLVVGQSKYRAIFMGKPIISIPFEILNKRFCCCHYPLIKCHAMLRKWCVSNKVILGTYDEIFDQQQAKRDMISTTFLKNRFWPLSYHFVAISRTSSDIGFIIRKGNLSLIRTLSKSVLEFVAQSMLLSSSQLAAYLQHIGIRATEAH